MPTNDALTLVATMAGGPQIVTFALDTLLKQGEAIDEVIIVHLSPQNDPLCAQALPKLAAEFSGNVYAGRACRLQFYPLRHKAAKLDDICDETSANAAWNGIYKLISSLKDQKRRLHVCIAGGRRMLALLAMSAAMLHFDHNDCLWHMYTPDDFIARSRDGAIMHAQAEDGVRLIQAPLVPWGAYFPALRTLTQTTPLQVIAAQTQWLDSAEQARCQAAIKELTSRQLQVLRAFAAGLTPQAVAEDLCVTVKTVHAHKTVILTECRNAWQLPEKTWLDYHFLRDKFGRYFRALNIA